MGERTIRQAVGGAGRPCDLLWFVCVVVAPVRFERALAGTRGSPVQPPPHQKASTIRLPLIVSMLFIAAARQRCKGGSKRLGAFWGASRLPECALCVCGAPCGWLTCEREAGGSVVCRGACDECHAHASRAGGEEVPHFPLAWDSRRVTHALFFLLRVAVMDHLGLARNA